MRPPITGTESSGQTLPVRKVGLVGGVHHGKVVTINRHDFDEVRHREADSPNGQRRGGWHPDRPDCQCAPCLRARAQRGI